MNFNETPKPQGISEAEKAVNYNKCILGGAITRDPEIRYSTKGSAVCGFGIAMNREWKSEAGEKKKEVTFVDVTVFGRQAEVVAQYFKKGSPILLEGRLKLEQWEDKQTHQKRSALKVILESFSFVNTKSDPQESSESPQPDPVGDTDDVPF